jgi:SAM-dependent methyltransferase
MNGRPVCGLFSCEAIMRTKSQDPKKNLSPATILDIAYAFRSARVLLTAYELGVFTALGDGTKSATEVAQLLRTDPRATDRLMDALSAMGLLMKKRGQFLNTSLASRFLVEGKPEYLAGLMHSVHLWKSWSTLTDAVRTGTTVVQREPVNERGGNWLQAFIAAMHMRAFKQAPAIVRLLDLRGVRRVLDVGGGSGAYSMAFVRAKREIHAVVFDLPNVVAMTQTYVEAEKLSDRIDAIVGDYETDALGSGFDLVFLSAIIHSNSVDVNKQLFKKAYDALNPKGRIVVQDHIMSEDRTAPLAGTLFALNMLVGTKSGDTYTESEIRSWMEEAGFTQIRRKHSPDTTGLMIGRRT